MNAGRIAGCLVLFLLPVASRAQDPGVGREALRYDGKPFEYWRRYLQTELKPELRIKGIEALSTFGTNGYATEATRAILEVVMHPDCDYEVLKLGTEALRRIGAPATTVVLAKKHPERMRLVHLDSPENMLVIDPSHIPALLEMTKSPIAEERKWGLRILAWNIEAVDVCNSLLTHLETHGDEKFVACILESDRHLVFGNRLLRELGPRTKETIPTIVGDLSKLRKLRESRSYNYREASIALIALLGHYGPAAKAALDELAEASRDPDLREKAEEAIERVTLHKSSRLRLNLEKEPAFGRSVGVPIKYRIDLINPGNGEWRNVLVNVEFDTGLQHPEGRKIEAEFNLEPMETRTLTLVAIPRKAGHLGLKVVITSERGTDSAELFVEVRQP